MRQYRCWCNKNNRWEGDYWAILPNGVPFDLIKMLPLLSIHHTLTESLELSDINKKEIFKGDIVKVKDNYADPEAEIANFIGVVEYANGSFYIRKDSCYSTYRLMDLDLEVIGNIFENPDLIPKEEN